MATQQISEIAKSEIADIVLENCPTKILLPNSEARTVNSRLRLKGLALWAEYLESITTEEETSLCATA